MCSLGTDWYEVDGQKVIQELGDSGFHHDDLISY